MNYLKHLILIASILCSLLVHAQPGSIDSTFNPIDEGFGLGNGANTFVFSSTVQQDGKVLIGGDFTSYGGFARNRIARLNTDGTLDTSFDVGTGANSSVVALAVQSDGKILIGGTFTTYNGTGRNRIARLNADGSLDVSFNPGTGPNAGNAMKILALPNNKIMLVGDFTSYNGTPINRIAQLNTDGSLDTDFNPGTGANARVWALALQADEKIVIGGAFTSYNGVAQSRIARINADGSLDTDFDPGSGPNSGSAVTDLSIQSDGKIVLAGTFNTYNGINRYSIARIFDDGALDLSFNSPTILPVNARIQYVAVQEDGNIVIGGGFDRVNNIPRLRIARLNTDGSLDLSYTPGEGINNILEGITLQSDGKVIAVGRFTQFDSTPRNRVARILQDGSLDTDFNKATGANSSVFSTLLQPDGKILVGGDFLSYNDTVRTRIARLNADGSLDNTFNPGAGANGTIRAIAVQSDGKVLIGGEFTNFDGVTRNRIARLNSDGSLDLSFNPGVGFSGSGVVVVRAILVQSDGKIVVAGNFTGFNPVTRMRILRLNSNGSLDTGFASSGVGANGPINAAAFQSDGKILIAGAFNLFGSDTRWRVARLNLDGSLDPSFNPGAGPNQTVNALAVQEDDKILIGGRFTIYNGTPRRRIARINTDGSLDATFDPGGGVEPSSPGASASVDVLTVAVRPDSIILLGGIFVDFDGVPRNRIAQLLADGSLDLDFDPGTGANGSIQSLSVQKNGRNIIGGTFTGYDGTGRNRIARVNGTPICLLQIENVSVTDETCPGAGDATLTATASCASCENGSDDLRFSLDSLNFNNASGLFINLPPDVYTVYITDINNPECISSGGPYVVQPGIDEEAPVIICPMNVTIGTDPGECTASNVALGTPTITDNCNQAITPGNDAPSIFPLGQTTVTWTANDGNGNMSSCTMTVTVQDLEAPVITCPSDVTVNTDAGECTASNVNLGTPVVTDNCNASIIPTNDAPLLFPPGTTTVTWTADDGNGNMNTCTMSVLVELIGAPCDFPVTGSILWEHNNAGVLEANVILSGDASDNALTDAAGFYELLVSPGSYTLTPSKTDDLLNGVSVLDVLMIQEHVTLINPITDPYKLIAADVNESNSVSTLDALIIAQSILGNPVAVNLFGDSWRFADATHVFPMPESPWGFPESINLANVDEEISGLNFVGIKKGDINGSASPNVWSGDPVNRNHLPARVVWQVMDRVLRLPGEEIDVVFRAGSFEEVAAYQFGLEYHAGNLELLDIIPGVLPELNSEHFREDEHEEGHLRSLWLSMASPSVSLEQDAPVFTLRFRVKRSSNQPLSELIWLSEDVLPGEAYNIRHEQGQVSLEFTAFPVSAVEVPGVGGFALYQNIPNPFEEQTRIGFYLPEASSARLRIFNAEGRALYHSEAFYPAGYQELLITDLPASGILYYHLETPNNSAVRKMVRH